MALNIEQRLGQKLTIEQQVMWLEVITQCGSNLIITPIFYQGLTAGSEFLIYAVNKMYVGHQIEAMGTTSLSVGASAINVFNKSNVNDYVLSFNSLAWDATAAAMRFLPNNYIAKNVFFSRLTFVVMSAFKFIGYRITF